MVKDNLGNSVPVSAPLLLCENDLRIIRSALIRCRKSSGSVRADQLIEAINILLDKPLDHKFEFEPEKMNVVVPFV